MTKIIATHQPNYIPWIGYFHKIDKSDVFVFLDDVQFSKKGRHNCHSVKGPEGLIKLNIPVKHGYTDPINLVLTNDAGGWKERHLDTIQAYYSNAPYFDEIYKDFKELLIQSYANLSELNITLIDFICKKFKIQTKFITSSSLKLESKGEERILDICQALGATVYYSGTGAMAYQNVESFASRGIKLVYSDYVPFKYNQLYGDFEANVSILDYLMHYGYDWEFVIKNTTK